GEPVPAVCRAPSQQWLMTLPDNRALRWAAGLGALLVLGVASVAPAAPAKLVGAPLVLQQADVPGLKQVPATAGRAREALIAALQPGTFRSSSPKRILVSRFRGGADIWSIAFLYARPDAATKAVRTSVLAARENRLRVSPVGVGEEGWQLQRRN